MQKDIISKIKETKINFRYDVDVVSLNAIRESSTDSLDFAYKCFKYGYLQGIKLQKAQQRREKNKEITNRRDIPEERKECLNEIVEILAKEECYKIEFFKIIITGILAQDETSNYVES